MFSPLLSPTLAYPRFRSVSRFRRRTLGGRGEENEPTVFKRSPKPAPWAYDEVELAPPPGATYTRAEQKDSTTE